MLPIEKGCLAIIVNSKAGNDGKVVVVGNYLGRVAGWVGVVRWEIDIEIKGLRGGFARHQNEQMLMRIDGYKEETKHKAEVVR